MIPLINLLNVYYAKKLLIVMITIAFDIVGLFRPCKNFKLLLVTLLDYCVMDSYVIIKSWLLSL